jgi:hypothetical protein
LLKQEVPAVKQLNSSKAASVPQSGGCSVFAKDRTCEPMPRGGSTSPPEEYAADMARPSGRSPRGERLFGDVPMGHRQTLTGIAGFRTTGIVAPILIKGAMNAQAFLAYIEQCLAATLRPGDIVLADNVSFHKVARRAGVNRGPRGRPAILAAVFAGPQSNCISVPSPEDTVAKGG